MERITPKSIDWAPMAVWPQERWPELGSLRAYQGMGSGPPLCQFASIRELAHVSGQGSDGLDLTPKLVSLASRVPSLILVLTSKTCSWGYVLHLRLHQIHERFNSVQLLLEAPVPG